MPVFIANIQTERPVFRMNDKGFLQPTGRTVKPKFSNPFEMAQQSIRALAKEHGLSAELGGFRSMDTNGIMFVDCSDKLGQILMSNISKLKAIDSIGKNQSNVRAFQDNKPRLNGGW